MTHRGPDDEGYFFGNGAGLGMRRLAIIDIEGGHQPITSEDGRYVVILNGEIYNYVELREKLILRGHRFTTESDTEVLVHLFEDAGPDCVKELNGMFAFAIWDNLQKEVFVFRDRIGIKPLYYSLDTKSFVFASDLSAIKGAGYSNGINFESFLSYIGASYVSHPDTIYQNVQKLEPGHFLKVSGSGRVSKVKYWEVSEFETLDLARIEDYQEEVLALLRDSIRLQKRSDVPIGTFLSGGLDSSCVVALLSEQLDRPVRTFSAGFEGGVDELPYARMISERFGTDHTEIRISGEEIPAILPEIIERMDEPIYDNALVPTLLLSKLALKNGVKVILNGTGGDELF